MAASVGKKSIQVRLGVSRKDTVQSYLLVTEDGTEIPAVLVDEEVIFTATEYDLREGTVAASGSGVIHGKAVDYPFRYAEIDGIGRCTGLLCATTERAANTNLIPVSMDYRDYIGKYHIGGNWYEDQAGAVPWDEERSDAT